MTSDTINGLLGLCKTHRLSDLKSKDIFFSVTLNACYQTGGGENDRHFYMLSKISNIIYYKKKVRN